MLRVVTLLILAVVGGIMNTLFALSLKSNKIPIPQGNKALPPVSSSDTGASSFSSRHLHKMQKIGVKLGRAYSFTKSNRTWCTREKAAHRKRLDTTEKHRWLNPPSGLLYVKVPKAASSTIAGVVHRISRNNGDCVFHSLHTGSPPVGYWYGNRDHSASFLFGSVRNPAKRAISRVFFEQVSQQKREANDRNMMKWLNTTNPQYGTVSEGQGGFQLRYLALDEIEPGSAWNTEAPKKVINASQIHAHVTTILESYDFLIVVERIDESLVVLQLLLGLDAGDMLTLDSKVQGGYSHTKKSGCFLNVKSDLSPIVKKHLSSDVWFAKNYGDYVLHAAANASLDKTIDALGRARVKEAVAEFRRLSKLANKECSSRAYFPCSKEGKEQLKKSRKSCYQKDFGCGNACIDKMLHSNV
jgi:hypothetical protein